MKVYIDIDETICYYKGERNYKDALSIDSRIKKINEITSDHILISFSLKIGQSAINRKSTKNTIPKLRFVGNFILAFIT